MTARVDLHLHTRHSDGRLSPAELAALLAESRVAVAALTDHDTLEGIPELEAAAAPYGIRIIPGVEVSVENEGQDLHILAYFPDPGHQELGRMLAGIRASRQVRIRAMVEALNGLGVSITERDVLARAPRADAVGRGHLAQALVEKEWVGLHRDAFRYYIGADGPAYRPKRTPGPERCLEILRSAGAVTVLGHPGAYRLSPILDRLVAAGLDGLEVYHPAHDPDATARFARLAAERGLIPTGGSDYHGDRDGETMPGTSGLGLEMVDALEERRRLRANRARDGSGMGSGRW
jgi:predicted metal-dependent phosphoesterase TrpH